MLKKSSTLFIENRSINIDDLKAILLETVYPVGALFLSMNANNDPNVLLGGVWTKIQNRVLLGSGSRAIGAAGGAETVKLTVAQMPSHNHTASSNSTGAHTHLTANTDVGGGSQTAAYRNSDYWWSSAKTPSKGSTTSAGAHTHAVTVNNTGSGQAHDNMMPYIVADIWQRTS